MQLTRKLWPISLVALWASTSSFINLGASKEGHQTSNQIAYSSDETPQGCPVTEEKMKCKKGWVFLTADALFWRAQESGLSFASKTDATSSSYLGKGEVKELNFKWDYGFRTGIGYQIPHGRWDTYFNYTWFRDKAKGKASAGGSKLLPNFSSAAANTQSISAQPGVYGTSTPTVLKAKAHWDLYLNVLDWELGKTFVPGHWFSFRPFASIKAAWIHQQYDIDYFGFQNNTYDLFVKMKNNYWGVGPRGGFNSQFWICKGFSIYANTAVSLIYGKFNIRHDEDRKTLSNSTSTDIANLSDRYAAGRAVTDLQIGLKWDTSFCKSKKAGRCECKKPKESMHFSLAAGWEQHMFFGQGEFMHFIDPSNAGHFNQTHDDLSVQGGTISARLDF